MPDNQHFIMEQKEKSVQNFETYISLIFLDLDDNKLSHFRLKYFYRRTDCTENEKK